MVKEEAVSGHLVVLRCCSEEVMRTVRKRDCNFGMTPSTPAGLVAFVSNIVVRGSRHDTVQEPKMLSQYPFYPS